MIDSSFEKYSGNKEIFDSGVIITFENEPITFKFEDLTFTIIFLSSSKVKGEDIHSVQISNHELHLHLINFDNSFGTGTIEPLQLGFINDKLLFLNFIVTSLENCSQKSFQYTWYIDGEESRG
jgi:hypothetical protein